MAQGKVNMLLFIIIAIITIIGLSLVYESDDKPFGVFLIIVSLFLSFIAGWGKGDWWWGLDDGVLYRAEYVRTYNSVLAGPSCEAVMKRESDGKLFFVDIHIIPKDETPVQGHLYMLDGLFLDKKFKPVAEK